MTILSTGVSFASAAAVIAMSTATPTYAAPAKSAGAKVHCYGFNTCKGTSDCKTASNECRGMNDCKGTGFKEMSVRACKAAGGSTTAPK